MLQIETPAGLAVCDEIAAIPGLDMLYVGPSDMSIRMRHQPEDKRLNLQQIFARVKQVCDAHGKWWGSLPRSTDEARELAQMGAQVMVWGTDVNMLLNGLKQSSGELDAILGV
jgi:2-keto-3-deoxy-L-rhamnonate aldolase RhmA